MENIKIPYHVGIILDGNGRWATSRNLKRSEGHKVGSETLKKLSKHILLKSGSKVLSVFAFSTENFKRDKEEVNYLMDLFIKDFKEMKNNSNEEDIKIVFSGRKEPLNEKVWNSMKELTEATKNNKGGILNICLNYGGQAEIVDTTKKLINKVLNNELTLEEINEETFTKNLYNELPPIDFLIRTSGEQRVSNFMLYELAYAEMYFPETYFPDFDEKEYDKALEVYTKRDRRFGGIKK